MPIDRSVARDPRDIIDIAGLSKEEPSGIAPASPSRQPTPFLSIWFRCCHVYGRIYRNPTKTAYEGRCPGCGSPVRATIGDGGVDRRLFEAW